MTKPKRLQIYSLVALALAVTWAGIFALLGIWYPFAAAAVPCVFGAVFVAVMCAFGLAASSHPDTGG